MEKLTIKEFQDKSNIEIIEELMKKNNGYITSKELDMFDIHRMYLSIMQEKGIIEKVASGIYIDTNKIEDNYYVFGLSMPNVIYSHMTALYFHGLSIKAPTDVYDITVKRSYNSIHLRKHNVFYVGNDVYGLGITEIETPMGNKVKVYDVERCICDIIRSKSRMDLELIKHSVKEYIKRKDKDLVKLSLYAEKLGIKLYDKEFVEKLAEDTGLSEKYIEDNEQKRTFLEILNNGYYSGLNNSDDLFIKESELIEEVANNESCVIVGRCADFILKDKENVLKIFIDSSIQDKINRATEYYKLDKNKAEKEITRINKLRANHYKYYTEKEWKDPANYDICINSDSIGIESAADLICELANKKACL